MNCNVHKFLKYLLGCQGYQDRMQTDKYIKLYYKISEITLLSRVGGTPHANFRKQVLCLSCEDWGQETGTQTLNDSW